MGSWAGSGQRKQKIKKRARGTGKAKRNKKVKAPAKTTRRLDILTEEVTCLTPFTSWTWAGGGHVKKRADDVLERNTTKLVLQAKETAITVYTKRNRQSQKTKTEEDVKERETP